MVGGNVNLTTVKLMQDILLNIESKLVGVEVLIMKFSLCRFLF